MSAGIYAARRSLKTIIIAKSLGGQVSYTPIIENYPGVENISGPKLVGAMFAQATKAGCQLLSEEVNRIDKETIFEVKSSTRTIRSKAVILSFGKTPRDLEVPGENEFKGRGVSYCATCDGLLFRNKTVAVIGGGNSAAQSAILLSKTSKKVYLIHRREKFVAEEITLKKIKDDPKIDILTNTVINEISGDQVLKSAKINNIINHKTKILLLDGIFVEIGFIVKADFVSHLVDLDAKNQIVVDSHQRTKTAGLFAAGDVTTTPFKQIVIAAGAGATAALSAYDYLSEEIK